MPDTIRTLLELNGLLADNTSGAISAQDIRDLMVSMMVHAEIGTAGQDQETLGVGWTAVKLDTAGAFSRGCVADAVNYKITSIPVNLKAEISCEIAFRGTAAAEFEFTIFKNPSGTPVQLVRFNRTMTGAGTTMVRHTWSAGTELSQNDEIQLAVRSNGSDFKLEFGRLALRRIGVE